nr:YkgJ family cysteine cluster protein [Geobacter sp. OR-1]
MNEIAERYGALLAEIDRWYADCLERFPGDIACRKGCSDCCRGLFDITLLDAWFLRLGFALLPGNVQQTVAAKAGERLQQLKAIWPELAPPYFLNQRPEEDWEELMPDDDETPCVLLSDDGRCLVYAHRPMTCRLHGLPLVDPDGSLLHDEWCTMNFLDSDPTLLTGLRADFTRMFREEVTLFRELERLLLKKGFKELDTFIPLALLVDYENFDWTRFDLLAASE